MAREESESPDHKPDGIGRGQTTNPPFMPIPGMRRCPQCGSTRIRGQIRPLVLNSVAFVVSLLLTPVFCAMSIGVLISLLATPITTGIAIVGRSRCLECRHRFEPGYESPAAEAWPHFPWHFHLLNMVVLVLLCGVGPYVMRVRDGAGGLPDTMMAGGISVMLGLLLWGSLIYHLFLYRRLRPKAVNPLIWAALFVLPGCLGGGIVFYRSLPTVCARGLLRYAELAPLPASATGIRYYSWSSLFSGEDFIRFTADANDIERFLAESPALQGQEPEKFSAEHMRLKYPRDAQGNLDYHEDGNEYFSLSPSAPKWYKQEIKGPARKYRVQPPRYQYPGHVLVDDETSTVYIHLCFS